MRLSILRASNPLVSTSDLYSLLKMKVFLCIVTLIVSTAQGSGFNRVLQFPREVSLENYVMLQPDFNDIQEKLTICGWVKFYRTDGNRYWFSYATGIFTVFILTTTDLGCLDN